MRKLIVATAGVALTAAGTPVLAQNIANGGATWNVVNTAGTSNGLPAGGSCSGGPGFGISDASIPGQGDAFDNGLTLFLNNQIFAAPALATTATSASSGTGSLAGLNVSMNYQALGGSPTLRTFITLANPTANAIGVTASWVTNVGSDGGTQVITTSSGDNVFTTADRYIVTDDSPTGGDPTNTHVLFGPGSPVATPSSVSQVVFDCAAPNGVLAAFGVNVPAGQTRSLLFYNQLNPTATAAQAALGMFDVNPTGDLVSGLTQQQLATVVNWDFGLTAVPEPTTVALLGGGLLAIAGVARRRRSV